MKKNGLVVFFSIYAAAVLSSGCIPGEDEIPVIGLDQNGNPTQVMIGGSDYSERLEGVLSSVQDSTIPALEHKDASTGWMLRTLTVGIGTNMEIGIGSAKVGAFPRARLVFSNSTDPTLP